MVSFNGQLDGKLIFAIMGSFITDSMVRVPMKIEKFKKIGYCRIYSNLCLNDELINPIW